MRDDRVRTLFPIRPPDGWDRGHRVSHGPSAAAAPENRGTLAFLCGHCLTPLFIDQRAEDLRVIPPTQCYRCREWSTGRRSQG
jgi:hypothetical protein